MARTHSTYVLASSVAFFKGFDSRSIPKLLHLSQLLVFNVEQLLLDCRSHGIISLDETDPCSIPYFCRGEFQFRSRYKVSIFHYCAATPYTAAKEPKNLYKRMRWNVEVLMESSQLRENSEPDTEYYFLCYRDAKETDRSSQAFHRKDIVFQRIWSIGRWIQMYPDPNNSDIYAWILCEQPHGDYEEILTIGPEEPSHIQATDLLVKILRSQTP
ncbi:UPF0575 protein C19orf67 homolog [Protopterus annectens]|uniref:UPF0575 protein C19orf67 homolog n=1 Tax=Protopterus annectens TaxID=7888 RepID=UPI001CF98D4C|nr:UPF0575 protein C19orf67 homolog [Protopterus annectens]